ncbi:MAG: DUF2703 domain-containing protein [Candidatus Diapherotrites archaeon]
MIMKIQLLYILDCPWCVKTKELLKGSLKELGTKADVEEILIDSDEKAKKYKFVGSPTIKIDGKDIQETISKGRCLPCEEIAEQDKGATEFIKQECKCGCRTYSYKGKQYPYPPKAMIKEAVKKSLKNR